MQVAQGRRRRVHAPPVAVNAGIVRDEMMNLHDAGRPSVVHDLPVRARITSGAGKFVRAQVVDEHVQVLDPLGEFLAVPGAEQKRAAAGLERVGGVALGRQRLVHLHDAAQVELIRQTLELRERQVLQGARLPAALGVELEGALKFLDRRRLVHRWTVGRFRSSGRIDSGRRGKKMLAFVANGRFISAAVSMDGCPRCDRSPSAKQVPVPLCPTPPCRNADNSL